MKNLSIILIAMLLIGIFSFSSMAYERKDGHSDMDKLNLTATQQQQILEIRQSFERDTLSLRQEMERKELDLHLLKTAQSPNQSLIDGKKQEIKGLREQLGAKFKEMHDKILSVLTPEQQKQWQAMEDKEESKKHDRSEENYTSSVQTAKPLDEEGTKDNGKEDATLKALAKITPDQATASALAAVPGKAIKVTLENENGNVVYCVKVKTDTNLVEVVIDAGNAKVLAKENREMNKEDGKEEKEDKDKGHDENDAD